LDYQIKSNSELNGYGYVWDYNLELSTHSNKTDGSNYHSYAEYKEFSTGGSEFLLKKGYQVHGLKRRSSSFNTDRIDHLYQDPHIENRNFILHYGDMTDSTNLIRIIQEVQ